MKKNEIDEMRCGDKFNNIHLQKVIGWVDLINLIKGRSNYSLR